MSTIGIVFIIAFMVMNVGALIFVAYLIPKLMNDLINRLIDLKPKAIPMHPSQLPPPKYLDYPNTIKNLNAMITSVFQRVYTTEILPDLVNDEGQLHTLAPSDVQYTQFVVMITLQVVESLPHYLRRSVYYMFGIEEANDAGYESLGKYITAKVKALLDNTIYDNIKSITSSIVHASEPVEKAIKRQTLSSMSVRKAPKNMVDSEKPTEV